MRLRVSQIRTDGGTQPRAGIDQTVVAEYAEAMRAGDTFPPLTVFHDGKAYWLADGFHRYEAHAKLNALEVEADVRQGTRRDAVLYSVGANAIHGLRRTNEDKRRAVTVLLEDEEWSKWSDSEIGRRAGVDHKTVAKLRSDLGISQVTRQGADGRTINTANIGKRPEPPVNKLAGYQGPSFDISGHVTPTPPRRMDLATGEGIIRPDAPAELVEAASQPVPAETPGTRMREALDRSRYDEAERVGKHMAALLAYEDGKLLEIVNGPSGKLLGLPKLHRLLCEAFDKRLSITL